MKSVRTHIKKFLSYKLSQWREQQNKFIFLIQSANLDYNYNTFNKMRECYLASYQNCF